MEKVKISVIIPAYNVDKYISECLNSLVQQTFSDIEIIIVNDGSTDKTQTVIDEYQNKYPNKIVSIVQENGGQSNARNNALPYVKGKYIAYIDADDYVWKDYFEVLYTVAERENSDLVICGYEKILQSGEIVLTRDTRDWDVEFAPSKRHIFQYSPCAKLYLTKMIMNNDIKFIEGEKMEDGPYGIIVNSIAQNPVVIDYYGYRYRVYGESTMGGIRKSGISKNNPMCQFPYNGLEQAIKKVRFIKKEEYDDVLCYVILKALAGFAFVFSKKSGKDTQKYICEYIDYIIKTYFPYYMENPYIGFTKVMQLPFSHRAAVVMLKYTYRWNLLYPFVRLYSFVTKRS